MIQDKTLQDMPYIHLFRTILGKHLYDVNRNRVLDISNDVYYFLKGEQEKVNNIDICKIDIQTLLDEGFLKSKHPSIIEHPLTEVLPYYLENNLQQLVLQVTQNCNLRCEYCVYSGGYNNRIHTNKSMSKSIAFKAIDFLVSHSKDSKILYITFYGGEPLLAYELMKECMDYAVKRCEGKQLHFSFTTNGTLIKKEMIDFFVKHDVSIMVSLDGPEEIHDRHRKYANSNRGSYQTVIDNLKIIKQDYPEYYKKRVAFSTVLDETNRINKVDAFFKDDSLLNENMIIASAISKEAAIRDITYSDNYKEEFGYEVFKLLLVKMGRLSKKYISNLLELYISEYKMLSEVFLTSQQSQLPDKTHRSGGCVPGGRKVFVNVNGDFGICEKMSETSRDMLIGSVYSGFDLDRVERLLNLEKYTSDDCSCCWAYSLCNICAIRADDGMGISKECILKNCESVRMQVENRLRGYRILMQLGFRPEILG